MQRTVRLPTAIQGDPVVNEDKYHFELPHKSGLELDHIPGAAVDKDYVDVALVDSLARVDDLDLVFRLPKVVHVHKGGKDLYLVLELKLVPQAAGKDGQLRRVK